ncbi:MAG: hypothetical protein Tsb0013_22840 [Phycisphaerales bacterium]
MDTQNLVYVSGKKDVRAIDPRNGSVVWEQRLDGFWGGYITLCLHEDALLVACRGDLYAFDARTGARLWKSSVLTGKSGPTMLLSGKAGGDQAGYAMMVQQQQAQQAAAGGAAAAS